MIVLPLLAFFYFFTPLPASIVGMIGHSHEKVAVVEKMPIIEEILEEAMTWSSDAKASKNVEEYLQTLKKEGFVKESLLSGSERPSFIATQAQIERVMAYLLEQGKIKNLQGVIHTPTPATPLCENVEFPSTKIENIKGLFATSSRSLVLRSYLGNGAKIVCAYPSASMGAKSGEHIATYFNTVETFSLGLIDQPLQIGSIPDECVGAFYLFQDEHDQWGIFAMQTSTAKEIPWGMWFGSIHQEEIRSHMHEIVSFLENCHLKAESTELLQVLKLKQI